MKKFRKIMCVALCLGLLLALCSCGTDGKSGEAAIESRSLSEYGFENMGDFSVDGECILIYVYEYNISEGYVLCEDDLGGNTMSLKGGYVNYVHDENIDGEFEHGRGPYEYTVVDNDTLKRGSKFGEEISIIDERITYGDSSVIFHTVDEELYVPYTMIDWSRSHERTTTYIEGTYGWFETDVVKLYLK